MSELPTPWGQIPLSPNLQFVTISNSSSWVFQKTGHFWILRRAVPSLPRQRTVLKLIPMIRQFTFGPQTARSSKAYEKIFRPSEPSSLIMKKHWPLLKHSPMNFEAASHQPHNPPKRDSSKPVFDTFTSGEVELVTERFSLRSPFISSFTSSFKATVNRFSLLHSSLIPE